MHWCSNNRNRFNDSTKAPTCFANSNTVKMSLDILYPSLGHRPSRGLTALESLLFRRQALQAHALIMYHLSAQSSPQTFCFLRGLPSSSDSAFRFGTESFPVHVRGHQDQGGTRKDTQGYQGDRGEQGNHGPEGKKQRKPRIPGKKQKQA